MKYVLAPMFIGVAAIYFGAPAIGLSSEAELIAFVAALLAGCVSVADILRETARSLRRLENDSRGVPADLDCLRAR
ncbi:hypothetical protein MPRF_00700 [Mycolicibacterium parafortuitum]|uniref:Uncharacterized protein n=1 Tax=Mycolicibacterium parafortuitum TaxID=39692 RepID=A0A7I7TWY2_MYCPF|nr:hypothetical protein [Mycolicibacterium parafortuitum]BBY73171.1 hypothetical protein MPRF_00700 [Mycolicibacterium parafortuitum]